ncbi:actin cytoskeleton-regulatory complex protein PAN1-like [Trichoplusia ni]|uniref:Actin cytoskeleton-regulatory complex protein PAN1-like n=1 Tax=Trichoplusia ni TaxID=7111 RepID=A0A7E5WS60_TRINI|nr:actin cytoskeleton-regulatory complex protein PAN1-like [Trichoplusia ni]
MKLVLFASLMAVAVAAPQNGLVVPVAAGPAPAPVFDGPIMTPVPTPAFNPILCPPSGMLRKVDVSSACAGVIAPQPVITAPAAPSPSNPSPLVQIILNINQEASAAPVVAPEPVQVVETAPIPVEPVQVVEIAPEPVQVVDEAPVPSEPISIGDPILPVPVVPLPADFN